MASKNTSDTDRMHTLWGRNHNPCYIPIKMNMVTGGSGSMEIAAMRSLHDVLHATVIKIIGIATQGK